MQCPVNLSQNPEISYFVINAIRNDDSKNCEFCLSKDLVGIGDGTQKIEDQLQKSFAPEKIVRFDSDEIEPQIN